MTRSLVLSGGGARAAYQVGVLKWISEHYEKLPFRIVTGSSAGSLNAAVIGLHAPNLKEGVKHLEDIWLNLDTSQVFHVNVFRLTWNAFKGVIQFLGGGKNRRIYQRGLFNSEPLQDLINRNMDFEKLNKNLEFGTMDALGITATGYSLGYTTTFCHGRNLRTWVRPNRIGVQTLFGPEHLMASTSLPILFPPIQIQNCWYGDGSMRQTHPLAPSIHLGATKILAIGAKKASFADPNQLNQSHPPPTFAQVLGTVFNGIFLDGFEADTRQLSLINRVLDRQPQMDSPIDPELSTDHTLKKIEALTLRPSQDLGQLASDYMKNVPWTIKFLLRGLGNKQAKSADFASYLLFEGEFSRALIDLGYGDAEKQNKAIEAFLA